MKAADEPAYLTVGTDVSAKYRGAFCEAKIKTVKRLVKLKVILKEDSSTLLVQDDQVKGPLRVGATVEMKTSEGLVQEAVVSKLTDASWYTVVFDDGDERTLRRTSLCLKGERHFAESETLDQLPLTNPEHFGTPVIGKKSNRGRRSSLPMTEDEKEEESSEDEDEDQRRLNDELLGKIVSVMYNSEHTENPDWYPALVVSPSCSDDITTVKKDQCLVRSFADSKFYSVSRRDIVQLDILNLLKSEISSNQGLEEASFFFKTRSVPDNWKMDMSEILESSSSDEDDAEGEGSEDEKSKVEEEEKVEVVPEEEPDPEERDNFLQQLYKFMEDRGTPINKPPVLGYKDLNLFKLFRLVYQHGGCDNIDSGTVWKQIYMDLGIPILNSAASYNVKTAYRKYLYGFEEYCRSANIQFRTIHHNDPKPVLVEEVKVEEPMEDRGQAEPEIPPVEVKNEVEESIDSSSESEKEELEFQSPRGRRKMIRVATPTNNDFVDLDQLKDSNKENKDTNEDAERRDFETPLGRRIIPRLKGDSEEKDQEESDGDLDEDDERSRESKETELRGSDGEDDCDDSDSSLTGTKVKVKYGRGKTQKIYEANIKSTEMDNGEVLYLVHYYGWNVRYDEWVKADRIIWLSDKGGPKRKQRRKIKSKEGSEVDERKEEEKQKSKRGRPPLKSTLLTNLACCLSKMPSSEGKLGCRSARNNMPDSSPLSNGTEGTFRRRTRHNSGLFDSDQGSNDLSISDSESDEASEKMSVKEEFALAVNKELEDFGKTGDLEHETRNEMSLLMKENERTATQALEILKQDVEESEQIVQIYENKMDPVEEMGKDVEKSPKVKGKRTRTKEHFTESTNVSPTNQDEATESENELETPEPPFLESKDLLPCPDEGSDTASDVITKDKVLKRRPLEQLSPEKKMRIECEPEVPNIVGEDKPDKCVRIEDCKDLDEELLESESKEMPSLTAESDQHLQDPMNEDFKTPPREIDSIPYKGQEDEDDDDTMPQIGPETLVCHEVDLDDFDEKYKDCEETVTEKSEPNTPTSDPSALPPSVQPNYSEALLALSQDESHSIKSESDITIEVDSVAEESQEGLCESESANGFEASTTSSNCSITTQEKEIKEKGQKRSSEGNSGSTAKKQKRNAKRSSTTSKIEKNGTGQSSDSEDLPAFENKCTPIKLTNISKPQKLTRSPARVTSPHIKDVEKDKHREKSQNAPTRTYKWSFQNEELDNMTSSERIAFLQDKLQEIRKYYLSLKSEVASIDRRRKRLKKKDREVTHPGASMSSASSETGMSPSSSSPPQNTVTVECR